MLQSIREKSQGWLAWLIVTLVCSTLVGLGIRNYLQGNSAHMAAKVNGHEITQEQLNMAYEQLRQQYQMQMGTDLASNPQADAQLKNKALNQIIISTLLSNAALKQGFRVTNTAVQTSLAKMLMFQVNGQFSKDRFHEILNATLFTEASFLAALKKDLLINQVQSGYITSGFALPNEVNEMIRLIGQKRDIAYFVIPKEGFTKTLYIPEADAQAYYQQNQTQFAVPEQVSIDYLELSSSDIAKNLHFSTSELQQFYAENKEGFTKPARWKIAGILVHLPNQATAQQISEVQTKINTLSQRLQSGENFAKLAEQFSEDSTSAQQGGLIGWVTRGNISPELEQTITTLKPNETSSPVKTKDGFSIVKLIASEPEQLQPFNQIKDQVAKMMAQQKAQKIFSEQADKLTNLTYANPNTLEIAAKELDLPLQHTGAFGPQGAKEGIAANPKIISAAFSPDVLLRGNNSALIEVNPDTYIVLHINHHQPASIKPYSLAREDIFLTLKTQASEHSAAQQGHNFIEQIRSGKNPKELAGQQHLVWAEKNDAGRFDTKFNSMILSTAFHLPRPENDRPTASGITLPSGDYAVIIVNHVRDGGDNTATGNSKEERRIFQEQLENSFGELDYQFYVLGLENKAKVVVKT
ncbi:MAG: SurA N-terminal domain-containing protein [Gammaproteobacteria bacterium]|nr:SurA N-terminal domain-containing protein [Gammaproteobacteria bacterium]